MLIGAISIQGCRTVHSAQNVHAPKHFAESEFITNINIPSKETKVFLSAEHSHCVLHSAL
jgi:hypothetical protein